MKKFAPLSKDFPHFLIGGDYNPEQWVNEEGILDRDMELMREANCNEMTMGIFAWDTIEPEEGVFDFSLLDERMDAIYQNGGRVILATPSGARPRWMAEKYPEVMITLQSGKRLQFSHRHNQCLRSPVYQEKVRSINEKLAERYGKHPALIAWHLSNEYNAKDCYCEHCKTAFREWIRNKYGSIENLNHEWWTPFWSHRYTSFDQIEPPNDEFGETSISGLMLDWRRFTSDGVVDFVKLESDAIRKYSDRPITTNCMGRFQRYDHRKMAKHLDFYSQDSYPNWYSGIDKQSALYALTSSLGRGMKDGKPYITMESAPGINVARQLYRPNKSTELQLFEAMLLVATGSDSVMYFQWRKGRGCIEKYHGAIVDHLGTNEHRVFRAVKEIGGMLKKMDGIIGTGIQSEIAIVRDYDTLWALNSSLSLKKKMSDGSNCTNGYDDTILAMFRACWERNVPADIIGYETDFSKYKAVILPSPYIMTPTLAEKIRDYVRNGGTIVSFYLTAMVNENDLAYLGGMPACGLRELFGLRVDETNDYSVPNSIVKNSVVYNGKHYSVNSNADITILEGAQALGAYEEDFFQGSSAVSKNTFGKGSAYHVAFCPDQEFANDFVGDLCKELSITAPDAVSGDGNMRVVCREGDGEKYYFVLNCSNEEQAFTAHETLFDILNEETVTGTHTLPAFGFRVLRNMK